MSWHATSETHHIFFCWDHFFMPKKGELKVMDLVWDKSKYGYSRMLDAIHECMGKKAGALLKVIEDGTGDFFDNAAQVKYTNTSFYSE